MPTLVLFLFRFARLLFSGHTAVAVENAALRLQLAAFQRQRKRPVLTSLDRLFWVGLCLLWKRWRAPLMYVRADTVVRCSASDFAGSGHVYREGTGAAVADPRRPSRFDVRWTRWLWPIRYGVPRGFTAS